MRSVKPGRGSSFMGGFGSIAAILFGIFWTFMAAQAGAPVFFPLFGIVFIVLGIIQAVFHFKNATGDNRYSIYDITSDGEEPDPLDPRFKNQSGNRPEIGGPERPRADRFCPYCGAEAGSDHAFCRKCGRNLS